MRIVIDARLYGLENTGIGRYITNLIENLAKIDSKNDYILLLRAKYARKLDLPGNFTQVLADFEHYGVGEQIKLPLLLKKLDADLVHFPHFNVPLFYNGPYVVTIHDLLMHKQSGSAATTLPAYIYWIKRLAYKWVFGHAVKNAKYIIVPTKTIKKELLSYYKNNPVNVDFVYEGVDFKKSNLNSDKVLSKYQLTQPYFIYTGNAYPHKNLERAITAFTMLNKNELSDKHSRVVFAIVGARGVFTKRLERLVAKYKAKKIVRLLGYVPDDELAVLYKNSKAFFYPSLTEGFGLPGLEAMEAHTLALVSDIPVFREVYQKSALFFDPKSTVSMVSLINDTLNMSVKDRSNLIKKNTVLLNKYSWKSMAEKTLKIYKNTA